MASPTEGKLRVFFIPFFASGHIIPLLDLARLFAARGVESTMVLTPANVAIVRPSIALSEASDNPIRVVTFPFPAEECGLPPGIENSSTVPSGDDWKIARSITLVEGALDKLLHDHSPDAIVSDIMFWYTNGIAADLGIPRIVSHPLGAFPECVLNSLESHRPQDNVGVLDPFTVPRIPGPKIELVRPEIPALLWPGDPLGGYLGTLNKMQLECYGAILNTFYELEPDYCDHYRRTYCRDAWFVGPVAAAADDDAVRVRGGDAGENRDLCMKWLDGKKPGSVVFVCFGSWSRLSEKQVQELAAGLDASGQCFLWVARGDAPKVSERGLVLSGWAPQVEILNHSAVGAFLTHCGWNSVLEAVTAGVPMLTWPLMYEQFMNERLVVQIMGAGARVFDGFRSTVETDVEVVPREAIEKAVSGFMEGPVKEAMRRVLEYKVKAEAATAEGGSSSRDLDTLVGELKKLAGKGGNVDI